MKESFVDDKLSLVSWLNQKKLKHEKLKSDYEDLQKDAEDMLKFNKDYVDANEKLKMVNREQNQEIEALKKRYKDLLKAFEELKELEEIGCDYSEMRAKSVLNDAKAIALEAMEGLTNGTLRGEKAEKLIKRYGEIASDWHSVIHKCDNSVCLQRRRFMDSLALLLQSRLRIRGADAFKAIRLQQWMIKGGVSKTSKPFEVIPANSFGLDVDPKIKSEKEAKKEQLSKLTTENEDLKSRLKEESDMQEALYNIMEKTNDDTEPLEKENNDLKEKSKAFEKENNDLKAKVAELERKNKDLKDRLEAKEEELDFYAKEFLETVGKEIEDKNAAFEKNLEEKEAIIAQKDADLEKQRNELWQRTNENTLLKLQNLINEPTDNKENAEKKEDEEKKFKKPTDPDVAKEVDDFRERLKKAGDNLKKLESLQKELEEKPRLKKWVSDELEKAIERKEREEKYKKEEEEAKKEMNTLMLQLKDTEDVEQLKKGIAKLLDYAQNRLPLVAGKFGLEAARSFVKGSFVKDIGGVYGNNVERIAQRNVAGSFVHTVSLVQKNIMEVWKRMTVILRPKALPMEDLLKATADEEEEKINLEAEKRKRKAVEEKKMEIAQLKEQLKKTERNHKVEVLDLKNRLQLALSSRSHMRGKTEMNLSSKTNGSSLYNLTEMDKKDCDNGRYSTPCETGKTKLRNGSARKRDNYSRDNSRSLMHSKTLLKELENSNSGFEKYQESQMKSDETFGTLYKQGRISFTDQSKDNTFFLKGIEETADEYGDGETTNLSAIEKVRERMMRCMRFVSSLTDFTWNSKLNEQYDLLKKSIQNFFEYVEEENKRTSELQESVAKKKLKTEKPRAKTRSFVTIGSRESVVQNLGGRFSNENSGLKGKKGKTPYEKIDPSKKGKTPYKKDGTHYKKIVPKISSERRK